MNLKSRIITILTIAAMATVVLAGSAMAALPLPMGINPATGVLWVEGDTYRLGFITSETLPADSDDINVYNDFVQGLANAAGYGDVTWNVIGSTSTVDARTNTATDPDVNGTGEPIFLIDGSTLLANDYPDLWNGLRNAYSLNEKGDFFEGSVATGSNGNGTADAERYLGGSDETPPRITHGRSSEIDDGRWMRVYNGNASSQWYYYALSDPIVHEGIDPEAPAVDILTPDMLTWSGEPVALDPNIVEVEGTSWTNLTYQWTANPADGAVIAGADQPNASVTITKAEPTGDLAVVRITLSVNNEGRTGSPITSLIKIDVYDDACVAAKSLGVELDETDIDGDGDCITNLADFALMAVAWFDNYASTGPVAK